MKTRLYGVSSKGLFESSKDTRKGGDQNQRKIGGREIKASEELYGMFSVTLSMPKSQVFLVSALLSPADSLVTGFGAVQQLPETSASPTVCNMLRGTHNFTFCDKFHVRPELPILVPPGQVGDACSVPAGKSWGCQRSWSVLEQGQQWDTMTACGWVCVGVCVCVCVCLCCSFCSFGRICSFASAASAGPCRRQLLARG